MRQLTPKDPFDFSEVTAKLVDVENELNITESEEEDNALDHFEEEELAWEETLYRNLVGPFEGIPDGLTVFEAIKNVVDQLPVVILKDNGNSFSIVSPYKYPDEYKKSEFEVRDEDIQEERSLDELWQSGSPTERAMSENFARNHIFGTQLVCRVCFSRFMYWRTAFRHFQICHLEVEID